MRTALKVVRLDAIQTVSREVQPAFTAIVRDTVGRFPTDEWQAINDGVSRPWWQETVRLIEARDEGADRETARARWMAYCALLFDCAWDRTPRQRVAPRLFARFARAAAGGGR